MEQKKNSHSTNKTYTTDYEKSDIVLESPSQWTSHSEIDIYMSVKSCGIDEKSPKMEATQSKTPR